MHCTQGQLESPKCSQQERRASAQQDLAPASFSTWLPQLLRLPRESPLIAGGAARRQWR